ncbi:hypothetical protein IAT40_005452 [Kwoniella sp. CBS 6097]
MDLVQNGESSKSPRLAASILGTDGVDAHAARNGGDGDVVMGDEDGQSVKRGTSKLVLPSWDLPPQKPLHSSLDLISLLHLDTLYNTYVRPFADVRNEDQSQSQTQAQAQNGQGEEDDKKPNHLGGNVIGTGKKGQQKRRKMEKGYQHLIEDCIDPTPMGTKPDNLSLLPLVPDFGHPPGPIPSFLTAASENNNTIELLPNEAFQIARLEAGVKQDGYVNGAKVGVREAEEKRKKKRAAKMSAAPLDLNAAGPTPGGISSPGPGPNSNSNSAGLPSPGFPGPGQGQYRVHSPSTSTPGTPLLPVPPPGPSRPPFPINTTRRPPGPGQGLGSQPQYSANAGAGGARPFPPSHQGGIGTGPGSGAGQGQGQGRPYAPFSKGKRPGSAEVQSSTAFKRVKSGSVGPGSGLGSGSASKPASRSASPMPSGSHVPGQGQGLGQGQNQSQSQVQRLKIKAGMRSKTEGVE